MKGKVRNKAWERESKQCKKYYATEDGIWSIVMELQTRVKWHWQTPNVTNNWMFRELDGVQGGNDWNVGEIRRLCLRDSLYTEF